MKIASFQPCSLNEYPGKISAIVFTQGCNFRCSFCHNKELWPVDFKPTAARRKLIPEESIFRDLKKLKGKITGITVSGGEPLIQEGLIDFIKKIKDNGFSIKLNTNGSIFKVLDIIVRDRLVDFIDMDVKAPIEKYVDIIGRTVFSFNREDYWNSIDISKSVEAVKNSGIDHFFSLVKNDAINTEDIEKVKEWVSPSELVIRESIV